MGFVQTPKIFASTAFNISFSLGRDRLEINSQERKREVRDHQE
jgi:hypothetical protein